jgi:hypothetical protein
MRATNWNRQPLIWVRKDYCDIYKTANAITLKLKQNYQQGIAGGELLAKQLL